MLFENYVPQKFAMKLASHMADGQQDILVDFLKDATQMDNVYDDFEDALESLGITSCKEAFEYAQAHGDLDTDACFFKVEDGEIESSDTLTGLYNYTDICEELERIFMQDFYFGEDNFAIDEPCYATHITVNGDRYDLYSFELLTTNTKALLRKVFDDLSYSEDEIIGFLEDFNLAYIKKQL